MKKIQLLLAVLLYTLFSASTFAAELSQVKGKVIDSQTKQPLPGATISVPDLRIAAVTNENGEFMLKNVPAHGHFLVQIRYVGYQTLTQSVDFANLASTEFQLRPSVIEGREVVITGSANSSDNRQNSTTISTVSKADLLYHPSTNLIDAISRTPGVSQITTGPGISKPVIRGLSYNRVVTLSDGVKQQGQQWGDEHGIEIDQYSADRVEVLKGPASLMYGSDALGGVINILDALPAPEGTLRGEFLSNYNTNNGLTGSSLMLQGNENGLVYRVRGSYKNAYSYKTPTEYVPNSGFNETNFEGQIGLNKKWGYAHLDASSFRTNIGFYDPVRNDAGQLVDPDGNIFTNAQNKDRTLAYPKQDVRHYKIALNSNILLGDGSLKATLGYQHNLRRELSAANQDPSLFLNSYTYSYDLKYSFKEVNGWAPVIGLSGEFVHSLNTTGAEQLIPDYDSQAFGGFAFVKKTWDNNTFNIGARFDYRKMTGKDFHNDERDFNAFTNKFSHVTGALGYTHEFNDAFSFKANAGSAFRAPNIAELSSNGVHEGVFRYEVGNPNLKPEQSYQFDASFDYQNQYVRASLGGFANYINNYIYYSTDGTQKDVTQDDGSIKSYPVYNFVQDNAFLRGIEASLTLHPVSFIHFDNSFSYTRATNRTTKESLPFIPAATLRNELRFEPNLKGTSHSYISVGIDNFFSQNKIDSFETPTSGYTLLNASIGTILRLGKNQDITLYVAGKNLLDKAYYDHLSRFKPGRLSDEDKTLGIYNQGRSITFGVNIPFTLKK
ncbi:TonB-dependent receptor [Pedobacter nutrimenti]|uniref:Iron complex outermembrane receptor protein n=1 Tax=Pedobacter nutrimenti TaxID=1241337 RepID=A0A318UI30_9SPHI|nr:TonB-dependent receptor [Pedobacter nutrimenti]PYF75972.1 iron complex outermembrane receptor protein [Pedobacter nutrimenti]